MRPVPDLLEEMAVATRDDGGEVVAVRDPPPDLARHLPEQAVGEFVEAVCAAG